MNLEFANLSLLDGLPQRIGEGGISKFRFSTYTLSDSKALILNQISEFMTWKYPSWKRLAKASLEELEEALSPVGLQKQRAKRVFALAQEMKKRKGRIPKDRQKRKAKANRLTR